MPRRAVTVAAVVALMVTGCASERGQESPEASPTARVEVTVETGPEGAEVVPATPAPTRAPVSETGVDAPRTGAQLCGTVTTTVGVTVTVEIVAGEEDCAFAEGLLATYYHDPPSIPEGSGAYVTIDDWECNSSSSQEPGRASTCRSAGDGEVIAIPGHAPDGGWCALIDEPTLDQLSDGKPVEAVCAAYIEGENAIDEQ